MKPKISLITLAVSDLERSIEFYRDGLGFPMQTRREGDNIAFFMLEGTWLSLYPREKLAADATVSPHGSGFPGFTLAHNEKSKDLVNETLSRAEKAGATLIKP